MPRMQILVVLPLMLVSLLLFPATSTADTVFNVTGTVTMNGNSNCGGPCIETVDFSMQLTYTYLPAFNYYQAGAVPGALTFTANGPLFSGTFSESIPVFDPFTESAGPGPLPGFQNVNYIPMLGPNGFELDLFVGTNLQPAILIPAFGSDLYGCWVAACTTNGFANFTGGGIFAE